MIRRIFIALLCCAATYTISFAQANKAWQDVDEQIKQAKEHYQKNEFSLAFALFKNLHTNQQAISQFPKHKQTEVAYYTNLCGLITDDKTILQPALDFVENETFEPYVQKLNFHIAEYYFRDQNFNDAIKHYSLSGIENLSNQEISILKFHKGYCHFTQQQFAAAKPLFNAVRQLPKDENYIDANYYYGFICFYDKQYNEAEKAFGIVEKSEAYKNIVPFYLAEIYYFNGQRDKALTYAEQILQTGNQFYTDELKQLAGHLWFDKKEYIKALPYLEYYVSKNAKVRREDLYQLAFCYYSAKNYTKCIEGFKQLGGKEDSLAQNSMYLLADAYLKTNQKTNARNAFLFCASNSSNAFQKQVSAFHYAKLSYELGYLDIALKELKEFIASYPQSPYQTEAKEILVSTLANSSNYKEALLLFEALPNKSETVKKVYPKILYSRAVELINERQIDSAETLINKIFTIPYNENYLSYANFWKGEIAYRNNNIDDAIRYLSLYVSNPKTNGEVSVTNAKYSLGYSWLRKNNFNNALQNFENVAKAASIASTPIEQNAYLRSADCYFMNKSYSTALRIYEDVISQNLYFADYAFFQKAIIVGATNKTSEKLSLLQNLPANYPNSNLIGDAYLEIANTHLANEEYDKAIKPLTDLTQLKEANQLHPQAYLKLGVANFNLDRNEEALKQFSFLSSNFPNTQESDESIEYIRNIFVETQRPDEFINFMKKNGKPITYSEADSITYKAALISLEKNDNDNALKGFIDYLTKYPDGRYYLIANYKIAMLLQQAKKTKEALPYFVTLATKAPNVYAEQSSLQAARTYYFELNDLPNAEKWFTQAKQLANQQDVKLEAMRGLLRCQYKQQKWKEALQNAKDLLNEKTAATDDRMMSRLIVAKNLQAENKLNEALAQYKQVVGLGKSEFSAEAQYRVAEILFAQNKLTEAEKASFDCINKYGSYEYWVTKSYILLGDVYFKQNDLFNAEATFKSVAENATIEELKKEAEAKLLKVIAEKNKTNQVEN